VAGDPADGMIADSPRRMGGFRIEPGRLSAMAGLQDCRIAEGI
jgi:hypothetical protein